MLVLILYYFFPVVYMIFFHLSFIMFVWSYWKTIFNKPSSPSKEVPGDLKWVCCVVNPSTINAHVLKHGSCVLPSLQFCLPKAEKERYEKEERPESQQEILWRAASSLPLYTRTGAGGTYLFVRMLQWVFGHLFVVLPVCTSSAGDDFPMMTYCFVNTQQSVTVTAVKLSSQTGAIIAPHVTCKRVSFFIWLNGKWTVDYLWLPISISLLMSIALNHTFPYV